MSIGRNGILIENTGTKLDAAVDAARIATRRARPAEQPSTMYTSAPCAGVAYSLSKKERE
ncbi:hypothetical protein RA280_30125 [Cupriavidus sp. CV2]|uniref:hypothetical protein n=1 Tax=Cupriavidus ulmosensis TaxID=3065913 RepID=UPI00296AD2ED|nr:hypothetical protein [Cupriavidus sp. CV2]MDW3685922.1 hypothetical protein [Cupriavidus sp. CV2]